ncbi:hypothetical protein WN51_10773 [Melipona quadrifasciata]|uniref:Uncharacterized protein n=1 Tax=Melipona quadrifasciata TaxID=166423 RepID=A0A0M9A496_9HYME|nr:hypothetical protein WN51_10773 [Melipona quadrifasciata]
MIASKVKGRVWFISKDDMLNRSTCKVGSEPWAREAVALCTGESYGRGNT